MSNLIFTISVLRKMSDFLKRIDAISFDFQGKKCRRSIFIYCFVFLLGCSASAFAQKDLMGARLITTVEAFGAGVNFPSIASPGTVLGRYYIPIGVVCVDLPDPCDVTEVQAYPEGGNVKAPPDTPLIITNVSGISAQILINGKPQGIFELGTQRIRVFSPLEVQLIRDERPLVPGSLAGIYAIPDYFRTSAWNGRNNGTKTYINLGGTVSVIPGTCSVLDQKVNMSPALLAGFKGVGSTSGTRAFNIQLENCPAGFNRVGHVLTALGGEVPGIRGALKPAAGSTATGVAIKLTDASNAPATFGTSLPVNTYNKVTGGSATVPMNASYVQTGATVSSGTVKGAVQVLLDYQ